MQSCRPVAFWPVLARIGSHIHHQLTSGISSDPGGIFEPQSYVNHKESIHLPSNRLWPGIKWLTTDPPAARPLCPSAGRRRTSKESLSSKSPPGKNWEPGRMEQQTIQTYCQDTMDHFPPHFDAFSAGGPNTATILNYLISKPSGTLRTKGGWEPDQNKSILVWSWLICMQRSPWLDICSWLKHAKPPSKTDP